MQPSVTKPIIYLPLSKVALPDRLTQLYFTHKGTQFDVVGTQAQPYAHWIKNPLTGKVSFILHHKLVELAQS